MSNFAFSTRDIEQYTQSLANYLPGGKMFAAKNKSTSNLRSLIKGLSYTIFDTNGYIKDFTDDISPLVTRKFLAEWESAVGLPDDCFTIEISQLSLEQRRVNIIAKLSYMAVQTGTSIEELLDWLGYTATVYAGMDAPTPSVVGLTDKEKRFTIVVEFAGGATAVFPYTFTFQFGDNLPSEIQCIVEKDNSFKLQCYILCSIIKRYF